MYASGALELRLFKQALQLGLRTATFSARNKWSQFAMKFIQRVVTSLKTALLRKDMADDAKLIPGRSNSYIKASVTCLRNFEQILVI